MDGDVVGNGTERPEPAWRAPWTRRSLRHYTFHAVLIALGGALVVSAAIRSVVRHDQHVRWLRAHGVAVDAEVVKAVHNCQTRYCHDYVVFQYIFNDRAYRVEFRDRGPHYAAGDHDTLFVDPRNPTDAASRYTDTNDSEVRLIAGILGGFVLAVGVRGLVRAEYRRWVLHRTTWVPCQWTLVYERHGHRMRRQIGRVLVVRDDAPPEIFELDGAWQRPWKVGESQTALVADRGKHEVLFTMAHDPPRILGASRPWTAAQRERWWRKIDPRVAPLVRDHQPA